MSRLLEGRKASQSQSMQLGPERVSGQNLILYPRSFGLGFCSMNAFGVWATSSHLAPLLACVRYPTALSVDVRAIEEGKACSRR